MIKIRNFYISLIIILVLSTQSIGYDLYAHSLIYYFNNEQLTHSYKLELVNLILPRYFLLSYIYEFTREFGIPTGWIAFILIYIPFYYIFNQYEKEKNSAFIIIILTCIIFVTFYSALTLALLWIMAFIVTRKKLFIFGSLFHPFAAISLIILFCTSIDKIKKILYLSLPIIILLAISWIDYHFNFFKTISNDNIRSVINIENFIELLIYSLYVKKTEIVVFSFLILFLLLIKKKSILIEFLKFFIRKLNLGITLISFIILLFTNSLYRENISLLSYLLRDDSSVVIEITWFSFGFRDSSLNFKDLDETRYKGVYE